MRVVVEMASLVEVAHEEVVAAVVAHGADLGQQRGSAYACVGRREGEKACSSGVLVLLVVRFGAGKEC